MSTQSLLYIDSAKRRIAFLLSDGKLFRPFEYNGEFIQSALIRNSQVLINGVESNDENLLYMVIMSLEGKNEQVNINYKQTA